MPVANQHRNSHDAHDPKPANPGHDDKNPAARARRILDSGDADQIALARSGELGADVQAEVQRLEAQRGGAPKGQGDGHAAADNDKSDDDEGDDEQGEDGDPDDEAAEVDAEHNAGKDAEVGRGVDGGKEQGPGADAAKGTATPGAGSGEASAGGGMGEGAQSAPLQGGFHAVGSEGVGGGGGACGQGLVGPEVVGELDIHRVWAMTEPWKGAGDYAKYGEAGSKMRLDAVIQANLDGVGGGVETAIGKGLTAVSTTILGLVLKSAPVAGDLATLWGGFNDVVTFDYAGTLERLGGVLEGERWDDDPFGAAGDVVRLMADGLKYILAVANIVAGVFRLVGHIPIFLPMLLAGTSLSLLIEPLALLPKSLFSIAGNLHSLSALVADADARAIASTLGAITDERDAVFGELADVLFGNVNDAGDGKLRVNGATTSKPGNKLIERFTDPTDNPSSTIARWAAAQKQIEDDRNDIGVWGSLGTGAALGAGLALPFLMPVALVGLGAAVLLYNRDGLRELEDLPEPPVALEDLCRKDADRLEIEESLQRHREELPRVEAGREQMEEVRGRAEHLRDKGVDTNLQLDGVDAELGRKGRAQEAAAGGLGQIKPAGDPGAEQRVLEQMRSIIAAVDKVPRELVPDNVLKAVDRARPALSMGAPGEKQGEADEHLEVGKGRVQEAGAAVQAGNQRSQEARARGLQAQAEGEKERQHADELVQEYDQVLCDARTWEEQAEAELARLGDEVRAGQDALNGWAVVHGSLVEQNCVTADAVLDGAEVENGEVVGLSERQEAARETAAKDVQRCKAELERQEQTLVNAHGLDYAGELFQRWLVQHNVENIVDEGIEDCGVALNELNGMAVEDFTEVVGGAYDTVGRIRSRLDPIPEPPKCEPPRECEGEDCDPDPPECEGEECPPPDCEEQGNCPKPDVKQPEPKPMELRPVTIHFEHNAPPPVAGRVLTANGAPVLDHLVATLRRGKGGRLKAVGHASVEGAVGYNQALSERRAQYVKKAIEAETSTAVEPSGVGEREAGQARDGEDERHYPAWRKVVVTVIERPTAIP